MASLSSFQTPPMLIVEKVVEYLEGRARNSFDTEYDINIGKYNREKVVHPLLWVSERWRMAALSIICDNCVIHFNSSKGFNVKYPAFSDGFSFPQYHVERLVKRVVVLAPSWSDLGSGKFSSAFSKSTLELPTFPSAATLMVCLQDDDDVGPQKGSCGGHPTPSVAPIDRNKETIEFAHRLRQMTPAATGAIVLFCSPTSTIKKNRGQCNTLVLQLCRGNISRLHVESRTECALPMLKLHSLSGLTSITQGFSTACAPFAQVAYRNADTLQELKLLNLEEETWRTLIYGGTVTPAVYSRLTKLLLEFASGLVVRDWAAIEDAASFPVLHEISLRDDYPFGDDLIFRGNGPTLQKLRIPFRVLTKNVLGRFNVLDRSGVVRMSLIEIYPPDRIDHLHLTDRSGALAVRQIRSILETTAMLTIESKLAVGYLLRALETSVKTAVLRELKVIFNQLGADEVLSIISAIPSLVTLSSEIYEPVSNAKSIQASEHLSALREKYPLGNSNFRQLNVLEGKDDLADSESNDIGDDNGGVKYKVAKFVKKVAVVAVQIAALCPTFSHVVFPREMRGEFSREVALAMTNGPFMPYANTLSRLIYPE
ncbi:hypothetical protein GGI18_001757 [Coemansia linderi]|uniref:Uncharacterized protein n=1 Tax=Coemansia linderi TaxID=2663919 RepID=A0ACC1KIR5_9FUNG|nr:hypothetical protein GGI18_001757 [Coemansia linderi]